MNNSLNIIAITDFLWNPEVLCNCLVVTIFHIQHDLKQQK